MTELEDRDLRHTANRPLARRVRDDAVLCLRPSIGETLTIEQPPAAFIGSMADRMPRKDPTRFTSITRW